MRLKIEREQFRKGKVLIAGVDEAGRGALAGPVVAGAVVLDKDSLIRNQYLFGKIIRDSKLLTPKKRSQALKVIAGIGTVGVGKVSPRMIDRMNIFQATRLAMKKAVLSLPLTPDVLLIDGNIKLDLDIPQLSLIHGDRLCFSIASASIVAKVTRDEIMKKFHKKFPSYNFDSNKGYGTPEHLESICKYGASPIHRESFAPVKYVCIS